MHFNGWIDDPQFSFQLSFQQGPEFCGEIQLVCPKEGDSLECWICVSDFGILDGDPKFRNGVKADRLEVQVCIHSAANSGLDLRFEFFQVDQEWQGDRSAEQKSQGDSRNQDPF